MKLASRKCLRIASHNVVGCAERGRERSSRDSLGKVSSLRADTARVEARGEQVRAVVCAQLFLSLIDEALLLHLERQLDAV